MLKLYHKYYLVQKNIIFPRVDYMSASQQSLSFEPEVMSHGAHTLKYASELAACVQTCTATIKADESLAKEQEFIQSTASTVAQIAQGASQMAQTAAILSKMVPQRRQPVYSGIVQKLADKIEAKLEANAEIKKEEAQIEDSNEPHLVLDHPQALKMEGAGVVYMDEETRQARRAYQQTKGKYMSMTGGGAIAKLVKAFVEENERKITVRKLGSPRNIHAKVETVDPRNEADAIEYVKKNLTGLKDFKTEVAEALLKYGAELEKRNEQKDAEDAALEEQTQKSGSFW